MDILNTVVISLMRNSTAGTEFREVNQKARFNPILEAEVARFRAHGLIINRASTPVSCVRDLCVCGPSWNRSTNGIRLSLGSTIPLLPPLERRFVERTPSSVLGVCFKIFDHLPISCYGIALNEYLLRM